MRSSNPMLKDNTFHVENHGESMSLNGVIGKTTLLLIMLIATSFYAYAQMAAGLMQSSTLWICLIAAIGLSLVTGFFPRISPFTALFYAAFEGVVLGSLSAMYEIKFHGIVLQAVLITISIFSALLFLYATKVIKATENFKLMVFSATLGIFLVYLASFVLQMFGLNIPFIHESGWIGIGFSIFVVIMASLNLVLDFDFIENGVSHGAPKYMEWYAGFGLLVTLVWLYLEVLRLLAKIQSRD